MKFTVFFSFVFPTCGVLKENNNAEIPLIPILLGYNPLITPDTMAGRLNTVMLQ